MATIGFYISTLHGEFNGSLKLAKKLKSLGHKVFYFGLLDLEEKVSQQEFLFIPILVKWLPKGAIKQLDYNNLNLTGFRLFLEQIRSIKLMKSLIYSLCKKQNREIHNILKEIHPDLLLIGTAADPSFTSLIAMIAYECQIQTIYLTDTFTVLPPSKHLIHKDIGRNNIKNSWVDIFWGFFNQKQFTKRIQVITRKLYWLIGLSFDEEKLIKEFASNSRIPLELLNFSREVYLKLPHLFLCPKEFDFPNYSREECYYAEPSIDLQRQEVSFDWSKLNQDKALIYCSLGTTIDTFVKLGKNQVKKFFQTIIDAVALKNEYQLVVSVSDHINVGDFHSVPESTIIVNRAPQLALLEKASLAIIQGGIHTIKECIFMGIPMIVFPVIYDQPENAERVEYHRLGITADVQNISVNIIVNLIDKIKNDLLLKQRLEIWKNKYRELENSEKAIELITQNLEQKSKITKI